MDYLGIEGRVAFAAWVVDNGVHICGLREWLRDL
jgi:hypothetical protein